MMINGAVICEEHFGWINWCAFGVLVHKIVAEESCAKEEVILRQHFDAWASINDDGTRLLSRSALKDWLGSFGNRFEAGCFSDTMFRLLDRDDDGFLDQNEFLIGILVIMLKTRNVSPPTPGLVRARRQIAFRLYDDDADGRLSRREWENLVNDNITKAAATKPTKHEESREFRGIMTCVQGVTDCLAARVTGEFSLEYEREKGRRRSLADIFWDEKRHLITYDVFFEAIDRGVLVEPENLFQFGELGSSILKGIRSMIPTAGTDFAAAMRMLAGGVALTSSWVGRLSKALPEVTDALSQMVTPLLSRPKDRISADVQPGILSELVDPTKDSDASLNHIDTVPREEISIEQVPSESDVGMQQFSCPSIVTQKIRVDMKNIPAAKNVSDSSPRVPDTGRRRGLIEFGTVSDKPCPVSQGNHAMISDLLTVLVRNCFDEIQCADKLDYRRIWGSATESALKALYFLNERVGFHMLYRERSLVRMDATPNKTFYFVGQINGDSLKLKKIIKGILAENNDKATDAIMGIPPNIYIVLTGNVMSPCTPGGDDADTLGVLSILWTLKAAFPEQIILVRGRHEASINMKLQQQCFNEWGRECGLRIWNSILDAWEFAPLGCILPNQGCVYGACLTEEIASNFDWVDRLTRPLKLGEESMDEIPIPTEENCLRTDCLTAVHGDRRCPDRLKLAEAVNRSYRAQTCRINMAAVIRLRHLMSLKWVIQDQSVCDTDISVKPKWFEMSKLQHYDREWRLDAFRGFGKESIVPNTYHQTALMQRCEDVTALTTSAGDGELPNSVPESPTDREIDLFVKSVDLMV